MTVIRTANQKKLGPRWYVTIATDDGTTPILNGDIKEGDDLTFEGLGDGTSNSLLWNHRTKKDWGINWQQKGATLFEIDHPKAKFNITYTAGTCIGGVRTLSKLVAKQQSGGATWTAEEGG